MLSFIKKLNYFFYKKSYKINKEINKKKFN